MKLENVSAMDNLPVEVVTHVLRFLPSLTDRKACSLVCKSWYEAYQDPSFRHSEVLYVTSEERFKVLAELKNENRKYFQVEVKGVEITGKDLAFWERFGPYVRLLSMFGCDVGDKTFVAVLRKCVRLESLSVKNCRELFMIGNPLGDANERLALKKTFESLRSLDLSLNRYLSDAVFLKFVEVFQNIEKLCLAGCQISFFSSLYKRYYPDGQAIPSESVFTFPVILEYIRRNSRQLRHLSFSDTFIDNAAVRNLAESKGLRLNSLLLRGCFQLSHGGVVSLSENQKFLTELDVSFCPRITDASLLAICSGLKDLVSLSVRECRAITDLGVSELWRLKKLNRLNLSECDLIEGEGILKGLCGRINPSFEELKLSRLGNMTEDVVIGLSKCLPNLRLLDLSFCYNAVNDKSIQSVLENNRCLQTLILTMCEKITDAGLTGSETGFSLKNLKRLRQLSLYGCCGVSDATLMRAFEFNELRDLNLSHCNGITERGLEYLSKNNPAIELLDLESCHRVNNDGVRHLVQNLKRLNGLMLGSEEINDAAAPFIARYGTDITYLDLRHCPRISPPAIELIRNSLPRLKTFHFSTAKPEDARVPVPPEPFGLWLK